MEPKVQQDGRYLFAQPHDGSYLRLLFIALLLGALACAIILFACWKLNGTPIFSSNSQHAKGIAVAIGASPASPLYTLDASGKKLQPLQLVSNGESLSVIDVVSSPDGPSYFLLSNASSSSTTSNVYEMAKDGSVSQLTSSPTFKHSMTFSKESGYLAYVASSMEDASTSKSSLMLYDLGSKQEKIIAAGQQPYFIGATRVLLYATGGILHTTVVPDTASSTEIAQLPGVPFALDTAGTKLADYNYVAKKIDLYALTKESSLNYQSSLPATEMPQALGFSNDDVIALSVGGSADARTLRYYTPDGSKNNDTLIPLTVPGVPWRIYSYDY